MSRQYTRIMALDVGKKRIGVALSDEMGLLAQPLCVLERQNRDRMIAAIGELAREHRVELLVLGLPLRDHDGPGESPEAEAMRNLGKRLHLRLGLPVEFVDESDSTVEAHELMIEADLSRKRRMEVVDKMAAAIILRRYLAGMGE